ncbi:hypothetical protein BT69DRAFT_410949 [Atractiella rhizophila]|nr:hypothetical protein BT69DRAFT_410949 [Atractiella rhizophila]
MMTSRIVLHLRSVGQSDMRDGGPSNDSSSARRNDMIPKRGTHPLRGVCEGPDMRLQTLGSRMEGGVPVILQAETRTKVEKGFEASPQPEGHDEYSASEYSVHIVGKNQ